MASQAPPPKPATAPPPLQLKPSASFRLRSPSLNTLRLRRVFDLFDRNADGHISLPEFSDALNSLGLAVDPSDVAVYIPAESPGLAFADFAALHRDLGDALLGEAEGPESAVEADMVEAFKVFDDDADGFISARELQAVLGKLGLEEGESIDRVEKMIHAVDQDKDGRINFKEFKHMMEGITYIQDYNFLL